MIAVRALSVAEAIWFRAMVSEPTALYLTVDGTDTVSRASRRPLYTSTVIGSSLNTVFSASRVLTVSFARISSAALIEALLAVRSSDDRPAPAASSTAVMPPREYVNTFSVAVRRATALSAARPASASAGDSVSIFCIRRFSWLTASGPLNISAITLSASRRAIVAGPPSDTNLDTMLFSDSLRAASATARASLATVVASATPFSSI